MWQEEEERELEEVEDLLEYYLQRAATTQSEAERLLAGARDLEESIGVSLSARRFEVRALLKGSGRGGIMVGGGVVGAAEWRMRRECSRCERCRAGCSFSPATPSAFTLHSASLYLLPSKHPHIHTPPLPLLPVTHTLPALPTHPPAPAPRRSTVWS